MSEIVCMDERERERGGRDRGREGGREREREGGRGAEIDRQTDRQKKEKDQGWRGRVRHTHRQVQAHTNVIVL